MLGSEAKSSPQQSACLPNCETAETLLFKAEMLLKPMIDHLHRIFIARKDN